MKKITLIKEKTLKNVPLLVLSTKDKYILSEKHNTITIDENDYIQISQMWCKSKKYYSDFFDSQESYFIKVKLNRTILLLAFISTFGGALMYKYYAHNLLFFLPMTLCVIYIFSYLTIFSNRYFFIKKM
ncbi:MAG TPA: hypothetical protein PLW22_09320 [Tenuifilum sp.]|jgi:hypothetical protein|uniref:hypothetical protein n=1 Tax=Tenuifilum sp. TaxID=2760880 RepID=UPI001B4D8A8D|nr:hypothetical protein [Chitinophagaceae bacterium]HOK86978.1 hypothetical protein [Tenuifilum sp.]HOU74940.1 hypothetical protein [Tenuifilum sp.]